MSQPAGNASLVERDSIVWEETLGALRDHRRDVVAEAWLDGVSGRRADEGPSEVSAFILWDWLKRKLQNGSEFDASVDVHLSDIREVLMNAAATLTERHDQQSSPPDIGIREPILSLETARQCENWIKGCIHVAEALWLFQCPPIGSDGAISNESDRATPVAHRVMKSLCRASARFEEALSARRHFKKFGGRIPEIVSSLDLEQCIERIADYWSTPNAYCRHLESIEIIRSIASYVLPQHVAIAWDNEVKTKVSLLTIEGERAIPVEAELIVRHRLGGRIDILYPDPIRFGVVGIDVAWRGSEHELKHFLGSQSTTRTYSWSLKFFDARSALERARKYSVVDGLRLSDRFRRPMELRGNSAGGAFGFLFRTIDKRLQLNGMSCLVLAGMKSNGELSPVAAFQKVSESKEKLGWIGCPPHLVLCRDISVATQGWLEHNLGIRYRTAATIDEAICQLADMQNDPNQRHDELAESEEQLDHAALRPEMLFSAVPTNLTADGRKSQSPWLAFIVSATVLVLSAVGALMYSRRDTGESRPTQQPNSSAVTFPGEGSELEPSMNGEEHSGGDGVTTKAEEFERRFVAYSKDAVSLLTATESALSTFLKETTDSETHFRLSSAEWARLIRIIGPVNNQTRMGYFVFELERKRHVPASLRMESEFQLAVLNLAQSEWIWFVEYPEQGFARPPDSSLSVQSIPLSWPDEKQRVALIVIPHQSNPIPKRIELKVFSTQKASE